MCLINIPLQSFHPENQQLYLWCHLYSDDKTSVTQLSGHTHEHSRLQMSCTRINHSYYNKNVSTPLSHSSRIGIFLLLDDPQNLWKSAWYIVVLQSATLFNRFGSIETHQREALSATKEASQSRPNRLLALQPIVSGTKYEVVLVECRSRCHLNNVTINSSNDIVFVTTEHNVGISTTTLTETVRNVELCLWVVLLYTSHWDNRSEAAIETFVF